MAKRIRIENADCGAIKIVVEVWQDDKLLSLRLLTEPTDMIEIEILANQLLVVKGE